MQQVEVESVEQREWMSPEQVATYLGIGRTNVYALIKSGALPSYRLGKHRRVRRADVEAYMETLKVRSVG